MVRFSKWSSGERMVSSLECAITVIESVGPSCGACYLLLVVGELTGEVFVVKVAQVYHYRVRV